ncbi:hypothetical protein N7456_007121 [Penicillium angulare]|uniref:Ent-kaurene synthase n=1 Tax=Penicillium angulare TaxID=116970 RepID=A0A9W9KCB4_9EURO|nr:hypothetical protein N7456_007121 [Penicillium angulare]
MEDRARKIITRLAESLETPYQGSSSMTPAVYDTAWVSMVSKKEIHGGQTSTRWLFPECFQAIINSQSEKGSFCSGGAQVDEILSTMAAILAIYEHQNSPHILGGPEMSDLQERIDKACTQLNHALKEWDVEATVQVGFEILVPSLLQLLEAKGLNFNFPGRKALMWLHSRKADKIKPAMIYSGQRTTILHSLEAFVGQLDFRKMSHSLRHGSMMGSPSSTAAYLISNLNWDEEAEKYLQFVVTKSKGMVPSAFPISVFEISWVLSTLLRTGFTSDALGINNVSKMAVYLEAQLEENGGVTGFAPSMPADADDTAKTISALSMLGRRTNCSGMLEAFETPNHFKTYNLETNESFSANCNVLIALLGSEGPCQYLPQITKALKFLCGAWSAGQWSDKWNTEPLYSMMLFADALLRVVEHWNNGYLEGLEDNLLSNQIPLVTLEILARALSSHSDTGAWEESAEITAYGLLTLKSLASFPWVRLTMGSEVDGSISRASNYLITCSDFWATPALTWVEKVSYGSAIISETYCLAALKASSSNTNWLGKVLRLCEIPSKRLDHFATFLQRLPIFKEEPYWRLRVSVMESFLLEPAFRCASKGLGCFPGRENKYLEYIPLTWTTCNSAASFGLSAQIMIDMMVISMLNFQVDKWFEETTQDQRLEGDLEALKRVIKQLFEEPTRKRKRSIDLDDHHTSFHLPNGKEANGNGVFLTQSNRNFLSDTEIGGSEAANSKANRSEKATLLREAQSIISNFVRFILRKVSASCAPNYLRQRVSHELRAFLLAHVTQSEDNVRLVNANKEQSNSLEYASTGTYYDWVRTTSADHTSCPYSFELFRCLVSSSTCKGGDCFSSTRSRYIAQDLCRHLATMCRQYNDYGSIARDREEKNLNSINFPEFHLSEESKADESPDMSDDSVKQILMSVAGYERECLELATDRLSTEVSKSAWKAWKVFIDVTDLYGQIYVVRDINS